MKIGRLVVSLAGLVSIALAYITGNLYFLYIAIAALFVGLVLMGAIGRRGQAKEEGSAKTDSKKSRMVSRNQGNKKEKQD